MPDITLGVVDARAFVSVTESLNLIAESLRGMQVDPVLLLDEQRRALRAVESKAAAWDVAVEMLRARLTVAQRAQARLGYVDQAGSERGQFRILLSGGSGNVYHTNYTHGTVRYCLTHHNAYTLPPIIVASQLMLIRHDEYKFLALANNLGYADPPFSPPSACDCFVCRADRATGWWVEYVKRW